MQRNMVQLCLNPMFDALLFDQHLCAVFWNEYLAYLLTSNGEPPSYEGESNENLKSAIKIRNTARLSFKLTAMILMVRSVASRRHYDAGMQQDGAVVV